MTFWAEDRMSQDVGRMAEMAQDRTLRGMQCRLVLVIILLVGVGCGTTDVATSTGPSGRYHVPVFRHVDVKRDVAYGRAPGHEGRSVQLLMDVYQPRGDTIRSRPALVFIHGGGYYSGDKADMAGAARLYARYGYVTASIDYRLDPSIEEIQKRTNGAELEPTDAATLLNAFDEAVSDSRRAVANLRERATDYRIDPDRIATMGWSAGGSTSLGHLLTRSFDGDAIPDPPDVSAAVVASGSIGGPLVGEVSAGPPPALIIAYGTDSANSANPPSRICVLLRRAGGLCELHLRPGVGHEVDLARSAPEILPFLAEHVARN